MESFFFKCSLCNIKKENSQNILAIWKFFKLSETLQTWYTGGEAHPCEDCVMFFSKFWCLEILVNFWKYDLNALEHYNRCSWSSVGLVLVWTSMRDKACILCNAHSWSLHHQLMLSSKVIGYLPHIIYRERKHQHCALTISGSIKACIGIWKMLMPSNYLSVLGAHFFRHLSRFMDNIWGCCPICCVNPFVRTLTLSKLQYQLRLCTRLIFSFIFILHFKCNLNFILTFTINCIVNFKFD